MRNFVSIESLRAYMAWWVVLGHASHLGGWMYFLPRPLVTLMERGDIAVNVFIIVSGFVITHLIQSTKEPYAPYLVRRFFRIFPIYVVCLVLAIIVQDLYQAAYFHPWVFGVDMRSARATAEENNFLTHIGLHLTLLHGIIPDSVIPFSGSSFLAPAWSLSLEWQFYLVAPAILYLMRRNTPTTIAVVVVCLLLQRFAWSGYIGTWQYPSVLPLSIHYFLIGILSRLILDEIVCRNIRAETLLLIGALIATISGPMEAVIWSVFFAVILVEMEMISIENPFFHHMANIFILNTKVARAGSWSYSTYLVHIPVFSIVIGSATVLHSPISQAFYGVLILLCLPLILFLSWTAFSFIEQPFNRFGRRLAKQIQNGGKVLFEKA